MTDEELIAENVRLKQEEMKIHAKRKEIADELRQRDLKRKLANFSDAEKQALKGIIITPEPASLKAEGK